MKIKLVGADVPARTAAPAGTRWIALSGLHGEALPNLMRKLVSHVLKNSRG